MPSSSRLGRSKTNIVLGEALTYSVWLQKYYCKMSPTVWDPSEEFWAPCWRHEASSILWTRSSGMFIQPRRYLALSALFVCLVSVNLHTFLYVRKETGIMSQKPTYKI